MKSRKIITWSISAVLTAVFVFAGVTTFFDSRLATNFAAIDLPTTAWQIIGVAGIAAGLALLVPAIAWQAAVCLAFAMTLAVPTQFFHGHDWVALVPAILAGLLAIVGYLRHPRSSLLIRLRAAADAFAEKELALERSRSR